MKQHIPVHIYASRKLKEVVLFTNIYVFLPWFLSSLYMSMFRNSVYPFQLELHKNQLLHLMSETFFVIHISWFKIWYIRIKEFHMCFFICLFFYFFFFFDALTDWTLNHDHYVECSWAIPASLHIVLYNTPAFQCLITLVAFHNIRDSGLE